MYFLVYFPLIDHCRCYTLDLLRLIKIYIYTQMFLSVFLCSLSGLENDGNERQVIKLPKPIYVVP